MSMAGFYYDPNDYEPTYQTNYYPALNRDSYRRGRDFDMSRSMRSQSHQSHGSSKDSVASDTEFVAYKDDGQPVVSGYDYGPYTYASQPQSMPLPSSNQSLQVARPSDTGAYASGSGTATASRGTPNQDYDDTIQVHPHQPSSVTPARTPSAWSHQYTPVDNSSVQEYRHSRYATANNASDTYFLYDTKEAEADDYMHTISPHEAIRESRSCTFSWRGLLNVFALVIIILALLAMFCAYPIISQVYKAAMDKNGAYGLGGTNSSGQVPGKYYQTNSIYLSLIR